jgi:hypothetical protein
VRRRFGRRRTGRSRRAYGSAMRLTIGALGIGALILFLVRQTRGAAREKVERASEAAKSRTEEYVGALAEDAEPQEVAERSADQEKGAAEESREDLRRIVRESVRRSEEHSVAPVEGSAEETGGERRRTSDREIVGEQMTVVGLLAKIGEAYQEVGGGKFVLSSENEGSFDLYGKEDELDDLYQQQTLFVKIVGRITDEDSQPKTMEVDEVQPA